MHAGGKVQRARELFDGAWSLAWDGAWSLAWDDAYGGLVYGFAPNRSWCDTGKCFWVQAEAFATAALLHEATSNMTYLHQYKRLWSYIWQKYKRYGAIFGRRTSAYGAIFGRSGSITGMEHGTGST